MNNDNVCIENYNNSATMVTSNNVQPINVDLAPINGEKKMMENVKTLHRFNLAWLIK